MELHFPSEAVVHILLTCVFISLATVVDIMTQQIIVTRMKYRAYMKRVLVDCFILGQHLQHKEQAAVPQQQANWKGRQKSKSFHYHQYVSTATVTWQNWETSYKLQNFFSHLLLAHQYLSRSSLSSMSNPRAQTHQFLAFPHTKDWGEKEQLLISSPYSLLSVHRSQSCHIPPSRTGTATVSLYFLQYTIPLTQETNLEKKSTDSKSVCF